MDVHAPMPLRLMTIFRVLSVLTLLEGLAGVVLTIVGLPLNWRVLQKIVHQPFAHSTLLIYFVALVNLAFAVVLLVAGPLLWMLRRKGLFLVAWTVVAETVYFILDLGITWYVYVGAGGGEFFQNLDYITGAGNIVLAVQLVTAFPIIAAVLIFFAYRYLGIPARPLRVK